MLNFKITNNYSIELKWFMYTEKKCSECQTIKINEIARTFLS